jgi:hypothetical protein
MFELMQLSHMLKRGPLKTPQGLGVILRRESSLQKKSSQPEGCDDPEKLE